MKSTRSGSEPAAQPPESYRVGYKRPPKRTRFKRGKSGNPGGRPRGSHSILSLLSKALDEQVYVNEGGRRLRITKREALVKQFANKGAAGDLKAATLVLSLLKEKEAHGDIGPKENWYSESGKSARQILEERIAKLGERLRSEGATSNG